jgi:microcystin-dependent protein
VSIDYGYTGEMRLVCGDTVPEGWLPCDGRLLLVHEHNDLFGLIYNLYGGDGETDFALPDLRGRVPVHRDPAAYPVGKRGGGEQVTVEPENMREHTHRLSAETALSSKASPAGSQLAQSGTIQLYTSDTPSRPLHPSTLAQTQGPGGPPHENMPPYIAVGMYVICVDGVMPSKG